MKCIAISGEYVYDKTNDNGIGQVATLKCNKGFAYPGNQKYPVLSYQQQGHLFLFIFYYLSWIFKSMIADTTASAANQT